MPSDDDEEKDDTGPPPEPDPGETPRRSRRARFAEDTRDLLASWDAVFHPPVTLRDYFEVPDGTEPGWRPPLSPGIAADAFDPGAAWWFAELCRFVYTPDHKEVKRFRVSDIRPQILADRTRFQEQLNLHKTGTHVAIYRVVPDDASGEVPWTILCFRGTSRFRQWVVNLSTLPIRLLPGDEPGSEVDPANPYVHQGFKVLFDRIWPLVEPHLRDQPGPVFYIGHSLGGALATLAALERPPSGGLYTFGCPRVGNTAFREQLAGAGVTHHRFVNHHDIVTLLPHSLEKLAPYDFHHTGQFHYLDGEGAIHHNPSLAELGNNAWQPDQPLTFLARAFRDQTAGIPECVLDHTPRRYADKLFRLAQGRR